MSLYLLPCDAAARLLAQPPRTPWTGYLSLVAGRLVGGGGFAAPPRGGEVEIGYFTLPDWQRQGHGQRTAAALLAIARAADPRLSVVAHTARSVGAASSQGPPVDDSASARILRSLGFGTGLAEHDEVLGPVWRWTAAASDVPAPTLPNGTGHTPCQPPP